MDIQIDVFGSLMVHRICQHVHNEDIVAVRHGGLVDAAAEFTEKLAKPYALGSSIGDGAILNFRT
jgi:hypothetical protein